MKVPERMDTDSLSELARQVSRRMGYLYTHQGNLENQEDMHSASAILPVVMLHGIEYGKAHGFNSLLPEMSVHKSPNGLYGLELIVDEPAINSVSTLMFLHLFQFSALDLVTRLKEEGSPYIVPESAKLVHVDGVGLLETVIFLYGETAGVERRGHVDTGTGPSSSSAHDPSLRG